MRLLLTFFRQLYFTRRLYLAMALLSLFFLLAYALPVLLVPARVLAVFLLCMVLIDLLSLFAGGRKTQVTRQVAERLSNGENNTVTLSVAHNYPFPVRLAVIDEAPYQFQLRNHQLRVSLAPGASADLTYPLKPVARGEYIFHDINVFITSPIRLIRRRQVIAAEQLVKVMPAFSQLRKYALLATETELAEMGNKRKPKSGQSLEFEQVREYVTGDDVRNLNWKATARKGGQLMINSFADERSQQIYCVIDKSRAMKMPFDNMSLLEYAINASLLLSQVALLRHDKAGLICFNDKAPTVLPASKQGKQMHHIMETLYNQETGFLESDFEKLQLTLRAQVKQRSLVVLFTNFESVSGLERQLPYIRQMARHHLLLVVFFENTGLNELVKPAVDDIEGLYVKTIAEKFIQEKRQVLKELQRYGILGLLTTPKQVTIHTINKYLELKSRQMI